MSSISSISGVNAFASSQASSTTRQDPMKKVMASVADLFGMSADEMKAEQKDGKTLEDIAKEKGISTDDLKSTLTKALKENAPADAPAEADFAQMATEIASGKGPGGHHGHGGPPPARADSDGSNSATSSLSDLLEQYGISTDDLTSLLTSTSTSSSSSSSTSTTTTDDSSSSDFATQLQALISKYGSKGNLYDTAL